MIQIETPGTLSFGGRITTGYHFNRLMNKTMPLSTGSDLYDISYTYGYKNDGRNGAGRITQIDQGQGFKVDLLKYDELGQVVEEATTIQVPMHGPRSFTTSKSYDSFGRIIQANYPDGDRVNYSYTSLGELYSIGSTVIGTTQMIVSGILYNGYGQISRLNYGNGTYTDYDYEVTGTGASLLKRNTLFQTTTTAKEQGASTQSTVLERNYTYNTQGMVAQLDRDVAGTLMNSSLGSIVSLSDQYNYDAFGRFDNHTHKIAGSTEYNLEMSYNKAGGIIQKDALATGITNFQGLNYTLDYSYVAGKPHQLQSVFDQKSGITSDYIYNSSGSIKEIIDPGAGGPQQFYWNEEQWLSGVSNDLGVHHYVYDYKGERIMKSSVMQSAVQVNDQNIDDVQYLDPYTLYINPYYVVTELQGGDKVSKHYYMNTQRVATDISINYQGPTPLAGPLQQNASDPKKPSADTASVNYNAAFADLQQTLEQFGKSKLDVDHLGTQPTLEAYYPELAKSKSSNVNGTESTTRVMFWYHPDYLGNVDLVTERDGKTYEFFTYNPWGEEMHQYNANTFGFASPYRFNSKEKDQETGLHYYGARYYSSKLSVWMSVDPKSSKGPSIIPFSFNSNNPIMLVDPDGNWPGNPEKIVNVVVVDGRNPNLPNKNGDYDSARFANIKATYALDCDVMVIYAKNKNDMMSQISSQLGEDRKIGNLIIAGHGGYSKSGVYVGGDYIYQDSQFQKLGEELNPFMSDNSNIVLTACHSGMGKDIDQAEGHLRNLAESSGATVYGNMSWGKATSNRFSNDNWLFPWETPVFAAFDQLPSDYSGCGISGGNCDYQGAANNLNNWRVANPNGDINIFSGLYIKRNGNIGLDD